ncbi:adapter protein MecA 1/2 [Mobilisporobacter senegalensis]|uniref:Adapter protein MecA 1/2 n=1 Tax=Mobilisporobacter senegalensis TaxID=1329262 RepID=A0A3N1XHX5_9FIRM|nr:adaptor protein MecA [Mobilisporobacter senegalensis]ROR25708.1 adapter protein MecA 1/2 [Mobilisporobacter senegalensis]
MKIEKISDNQIRCTLSKEDLADRELRISELAYGTEKAKNLFRDMMQQASYEFGFEADDIPLMIEAIPISSECLILVITKVENPDELDTRFSKFSESRDSDMEDFDYENTEDTDNSYADEIINSFAHLDEILDPESKNTEEDTNFIPLPKALGSSKSNKKEEVKEVTPAMNLMKVYSFDTLDDVIHLANIVVFYYKGKNSLYKNQDNKRYYLITYKSDHSPKEYNKVCNIISEYGKIERTTYASSSYFDEHYQIIIRDQAIQLLSSM